MQQSLRNRNLYNRGLGWGKNKETDEHKQQCNLYNRGFGWEKAKKQTNKDIRCQESPSLTYFLGEIWLSDGSS